MSASTAARRPRIFYGWWVVLAAFSTTFIGFGSAYTFGAFAESLQREFAASRASISLVFSLAGFLYFALGCVSGPLADRWGARRLAVAGMWLVGAGLIAAGLSRDLRMVYLAYGLGIGLGVGCSYVPVVGAVQRWFSRRRGFASGLAVSGIGVGTLVMPVLAAALIDALDWRTAYVLLGVGAAVAGSALAMLVANDPREQGLLPDGDTAAPGAPARPVAGLTVRQAVASRRFMALYAACLLCSFGVFVPFVHLVPHATDHGVPAASAVLLLGVIGVGSTAGRFLLGGAMDRLGRGRALPLMFLGMALSLGLWAGATSWWPLVAFALVFGVFYGGWVAVLPAVVTDSFGGRHVSGIIGALYTSVAVGTLLGPIAAGYVFDTTRSYTIAILASAVTNVLAACIALAQPPIHTPGSHSDTSGT